MFVGEGNFCNSIVKLVLEQITAAIYGEDLLNAVNYTFEKIQPQHRKPACVGYALDLGVLFALESSLDSAGINLLQTPVLPT